MSNGPTQPDYIDPAGLNITGGVKNLFLGFLQEFFAQQPKWTWSQDEDDTEILIVDKMPNDLTVLEKQPIIVLNRGSIQAMDVSIDNIKEKDLQTGETEYTDLFSGTITFNCINRLGLEAEELGTRVALALITFEKILRKRGIHEYKDVTIGEEALIEADSDIIATNCPVTLRYTAQLTWKLVEGTEQLNDAGITLCTDRERIVQEIQPDKDDE